jgi:CBS-domain-containing membrane protein
MKPCPAIDDNGTVEYEEDLPYEYESHKVKPVKGFNDYIKALNETVAMIDCDNLEDCIQHTLGILQKMVGSLDAAEIAIKAYQVASPKAKTDLVINLLKNNVYDYLTSQDSQVKIIGNGGSKDTKDNIPEDVYEQGLDALCDDIVDEILGRLAKENGGDYEAV